MASQEAVLKRLQSYVELVNAQRAIIRDIRKLTKQALTIHDKAQKAIERLDQVEWVKGPDQFGDIEDLEVLSLFSEGAGERNITTDSKDTLADQIFGRTQLREIPLDTGAKKILDYALSEDNQVDGADFEEDETEDDPEESKEDDDDSDLYDDEDFEDDEDYDEEEDDA